MAKKANTNEQAVRVTTSGEYAVLGPKQSGVERTSVAGTSPSPTAKPRDKSYTFHGDYKITTSGVPIKSR